MMQHNELLKDSETLVGDVRDKVLQLIKSMEKPYPQLLDASQERVIADALALLHWAGEYGV